MRRPGRAGGARGRPLRANPSSSTEEPTAVRRGPAGGGGAGRRQRRPTAAGDAPAGSTGQPGTTDEPAGAGRRRRPTAAIDPAVRARARQIAARLAVPRPRRATRPRRSGAGELASLPYRGGSDDIDLDRTIEVLAERPVPEDEDIVVRDRVRTRRVGRARWSTSPARCAASGSAPPPRRSARWPAELSRDDLAVVAFWSDAAILLHLGQRVEPLQLLDRLLAHRRPAG